MEIIWRQKLGFPEKPYLIRWVLDLGAGGSIRLHHWLSSDDMRYSHDHSWWFVVFVLWGGYWDCTPIFRQGQMVGWEKRWLRPGAVKYRTPEHKHCVEIPEGRSNWSLLLTGPVVRKWGFWIKQEKWLRAMKYFFTYGHHSPYPNGKPRRPVKIREGRSERGLPLE